MPSPKEREFHPDEKSGQPIWLQEIRHLYLEYKRVIDWPTAKKTTGIIEAVKANPNFALLRVENVMLGDLFYSALGKLPFLPEYVMIEERDLDKGAELIPGMFPQESYRFYLPRTDELYRFMIDSNQDLNHDYREKKREQERLMKALYIPGSAHFLGFKFLRDHQKNKDSFYHHPFSYHFEDAQQRAFDMFKVLLEMESLYEDEYKNILSETRRKMEDLVKRNRERVERMDVDKGRVIRLLVHRIISLFEEQLGLDSLPENIRFGRGTGRLYEFSFKEKRIKRIPDDRWGETPIPIEEGPENGDAAWTNIHPILYELLEKLPYNQKTYVKESDDGE